MYVPYFRYQTNQTNQTNELQSNTIPSSISPPCCLVSFSMASVPLSPTSLASSSASARLNVPTEAAACLLPPPTSLPFIPEGRSLPDVDQDRSLLPSGGILLFASFLYDPEREPEKASKTRSNTGGILLPSASANSATG